MAKPTPAEIKALAEGALTARTAADAAKAAFDADNTNADLKTAWETADTAAKDAEAKTDALSQGPTPAPGSDKNETIAKLKKRKQIVNKKLAELGANDDDVDDVDDGEDDDEDDDDAPLTRGDLKRMRAQEAQKTTQEMANTIVDVDDRAAVVEALKSVVPSGDPDADFKKAVAIASADRNKAIRAEYDRRTPGQGHSMGAGSPARRDAGGEFTPTTEEAKYMRPPFNLSKEDILNARKGAAK